VSAAAGRRATTCATAAMREVLECCMLDGLLTEDRRLREPCASCCSVDESIDRPGPIVLRTVPKMYLPSDLNSDLSFKEIRFLIGSFWYRKGCFQRVVKRSVCCKQDAVHLFPDDCPILSAKTDTTNNIKNEK
jgi:hypothetical protein